MDEKVFASSEDGKYHVWRPRDERLNPEYVVPWKRSGILTLGYWRSMTSSDLLQILKRFSKDERGRICRNIGKYIKPNARRIYPHEVYLTIKIVHNNSAVHTSQLIQT